MFSTTVKEPRNGNGVGRINEVTLRRARLVLGWVTVFGRANHLGTKPATQANSAFYPTAGRRMSTGQSAMTLCGWGVKTGWLIPYADKRVRGWQVKLCDPSLTGANLSTLEVSIAHMIMRYTNALFT